MTAEAPRRGLLWIGGHFTEARDRRRAVVLDARAAPSMEVAVAGEAELAAAVGAARMAGTTSWLLAPSARAELLFETVARLRDQREAWLAVLRRAAGTAEDASRADVARALDRAAWFAGCSDKLGTLLAPGGTLAGGDLVVSFPEPAGVVALGAPQSVSFAALVPLLFAALAPGNAVVLVADAGPAAPLAVALAEALTRSALPAGAVSVLTGPRDELLASAAARDDVGLLAAAGSGPAAVRELERRAAPGSIRVAFLDDLASSRADDHVALACLSRLVGWKTVWHPVGF